MGGEGREMGGERELSSPYLSVSSIFQANVGVEEGQWSLTVRLGHTHLSLFLSLSLSASRKPTVTVSHTPSLAIRNVRL